MKEANGTTFRETTAGEIERRLEELIDLAERTGYVRAAEGLRAIADVLPFIEHDPCSLERLFSEDD